MELDELKQAWKAIPDNQTKPNKDIMELIRQESHGPIARLKTGYRKQMVLMSMIPFILLLTNADNMTGVLQSFMFWSYVVFCVGVITIASMNYREVVRMEVMDGALRSHLERQVGLLQKRLNLLIIGLPVAMLYFIVLTEVLPYFQYYRMLATWHGLPVLLRFSVYAALLIAQYFFSRKALHSKFGRHLAYLKELVAQMK